MMKKDSKVLIIGGGFAGARVAQDLAKAGFNHVTLVDKKDYFEVTYAALRTLAQPELGLRSRLPYAKFIQGHFHQGEVATLAPNHAELTDGSRLEFDVAVIASGSSYASLPLAKSQQAMQLSEREIELIDANQTLVQANNVLIIGGGIVGVELAGEIADHHPDKKVTLVHGGARLVPELSEKAAKVADKQLRKLGVHLIYNKRLTDQDPLLDQANLVYTCAGVTPNTDIMSQHFGHTLDDQSRLKVDGHFRVEGTQHLFALGDCANVPEGKLGYLADQQANALAKTLIALSDSKSPKAYKPNPMMALVPVGQQQGLVQLPFMVTTMNLMVNMKQKDMFILKSYKNLRAH
ncbi:NAD(P)/FAD-dependent oxidoreductase [Marinomonas algarum]|uniref:FAD-dependent oxidoreductase n=1 Tax=Marinomonas algarum TaxID=2883105 RepID=A0A9X1LE31_9GAMM|nr:FAD-dependent oxidoreductase [Marinomonas algarum]MCB5160450.1 FAD-dependent oxidoreductase [Marinomonas algarum]